MKKYLISLFTITLAVILLSGIFIWFLNKDQAASLGFIPDNEWSKRKVVLPEFGLGMYDVTIDTSGITYIGYVDYSKDEKLGQIFITGIDQDGKYSIPTQDVIQMQNIADVALTVYKDNLHVYWFGKNSGSKYSLYNTVVDLQGTVLEQKAVIQNEFVNVEDLTVSVSPEGDCMLAWIENSAKSNRLGYLLLDSTGLIIGTPHYLNIDEAICVLPQIRADHKGNFHVIWKVQKEIWENSAKVEVCYLYYLSVNDQGQYYSEPIIIDQITSNAVAMALDKDKLYLTWNKIVPILYNPDVSLVESIFSNYVIFGTVIDLNNPQPPFRIQKITQQRGPTFNLSLSVDKIGLVHLVYLDEHSGDLALTHEIYDQDFTNQLKPPTRLYPDQDIVPEKLVSFGHYKTHLLPDSQVEKGLYCVWVESSSEGMNICYANTVKPAKISPLQVIGINRNFIGINIFMSFAYVLSLPFANFFATIFILIVIMLVYLGVEHLAKRTQFARVISNPYVGFLVMLATQLIFYVSVGMESVLFWPTSPTVSQQIFVFVLSSIAILVFITINRERTGIFNSGFYVLFWLYWVDMASLMFVLGSINFA